MNKLDDRWEPMPDYMKEEIEGGKDIIGGRSKSDKATLNIISNNGNVIWQMELAKTRDQVVINLNGFTAGSYQVAIRCGNKTISSSTLTVAK